MARSAAGGSPPCDTGTKAFARSVRGAGDTTVPEQLQRLPAREAELDWDQECDRRLDVAKSPGMAIAVVSMAKSRLLARLKEMFREVQSEADHE
jgi:hypothetical protein